MLLLLLVKACCMVGLVSGAENTRLYVLGLFPFHGEWCGGRGILPAVQMALEEINNRTDILPGYELVLEYKDTKCNPFRGTYLLFDDIYKSTTKIMVLGAGCSSVSQATGEVSHNWNLVQLSYSSVSPALSDKKRYPWFFRVGASELVINPPRIEMMRLFKWDRVAIIHQSQDLFSGVAVDLIQEFHRNNITLLTSEVFQSDPTLQVRNLKRHDARIIVCGMYVSFALEVFCEAYKQGMYGPKYVWITIGWLDDKWWETPIEGCSREQMLDAVEGHFATGLIYLNPALERGVAGKTSVEWQDEYLRRINHTLLRGSVMATQGYDSVYCIALALNTTMNNLRELGSEKRLEDFKYEDKEFAQLIYQNMKRTSFTGVRGNISFDENHDVIGMVKIERVQGGERRVVGLYDPKFPQGLRIEWTKNSSTTSSLVWKTKDGLPPKDSSDRVVSVIFVSRPVYIAMSTVSFLGMLVAVGFLVFNIKLRKIRLIKMSSPNINSAILVGCMITYCTAFFEEIKLGAPGLLYCKIRIYFATTGFCLVFGALFSKTWRVHVIFTNSKLKKKVVKDSQLLAIVFAVLLLNIGILLTWEIVDPVQIRVQNLTERVLEDGDILLQTQVHQCYSDNQAYFLATIYTLQGVMLLFGAFLAWETRKVKIAALNDSQHIGMCIYNVFVLSIMGMTTSFLLDTQVQLKYILTSVLMLLGNTLTQCIIFVPKVSKYLAARSKSGDNNCCINDLQTIPNSGNAIMPTEKATEISTKVCDLENELKKARETISQQIQLIAALREKPRGSQETDTRGNTSGLQTYKK